MFLIKDCSEVGIPYMQQYPWGGGGAKIATIVEVSLNTRSISKAAVFVERGKPQTDLKSIIGTWSRDR